MVRKVACWMIALTVVLLAAVPVFAQPDRSSVGLGVSVGAAWPQASSDHVSVGSLPEIDDWATSFNWGFYVDIPIIWTFHITPSAELYKFGDENATDIALAFKFIIPVWKLDLYVGCVPGLTAVGNDTLFHVGGVAGVSFNLFSTLDLFVQAMYKVMFVSDHNVRVLHANLGVLYHF